MTAPHSGEVLPRAHRAVDELDGVGQRDLVRSGLASAHELVEAAIRRIEALNPRLNAVITERFERALTAARGPEASSGAPFRGVPMLLKDAVCHSAGDPFHCGMKVLKDSGWVESSDTYLAARFRAAGFIFLGKTNTPELAGATTTEPLAYGPTRNPWDTAQSAGGSSGGSAAAVAAGFVPVAHGNDMGGSIRIPASACGVVGLKPSRGRVSLGPEFGEYLGAGTQEHVLTRTVRDSAAVLDVISGYEPGDPSAAPPPAGTFLAAVTREPRALRIGVLESPGADAPAVAPACEKAVHDTIRLLESCGHAVVTVVCPAFWHRPATRGIVGGVLRRLELERWARRIGRPISLDEVEPLTAHWIRQAQAVTAAEYVTVLQKTQEWTRELVASWRAQCDLLLTPTLPVLPPAIGELAPRSHEPALLDARMAQHVFFTAPFNSTGEPAISLPLVWTDAGLPVGVQLVAPFAAEELLFSVAGQLERAAPWHERYARLSVS